MIPLALIGALLMFGLAASKAQAQAAPALPAPTEPKKEPRTTLFIKKPTKKKLKRRKKLISKTEKKTAIKKVTAIAQSPRARQALNNLLRVVKSKTVSPAIKAAAEKKVATLIAYPQTVKAASLKTLPTAAKIQIAKAVAKADATTKPTPDQAAKILQIWTKGGGNQGTKTNRSETVKRCQLLMGFTGNDADGIIGPKTRARAKALGYTLAPRSAQKPGAVGYEVVLGY